MACAKVVSQFEVLSAEDAGRRRHWSDEEKIRIVEESLRGHRQGSATARRYGISRSLLSTWRRDYRRGALSGADVHGFVPLLTSLDEAAHCEPPPEARAGVDERIEIVLANGRRLTIPATLNPAVLARLLPVLDGS